MHALEKQLFFAFKLIPIDPGILLPWLVTLIVAGCAYLATRKLTLSPGPVQAVLEMITEGLANFIGAIIGEKHAREMVPFFSTVFIYILSANLLGVIPGLKSPTSIISNCLGMALIIFIMIHYEGLKRGGFGYIKHFWGEPAWLGPLMFPLHIISELARPLSLTLRLFGNIMGEDVVVIVLTVSIFPLIVPIPMLCLQLFTSVIQALVFTMLSSIYVSGAIAAADHGH